MISRDKDPSGSSILAPISRHLMAFALANSMSNWFSATIFGRNGSLANAPRGKTPIRMTFDSGDLALMRAQMALMASATSAGVFSRALLVPLKLFVPMLMATYFGCNPSNSPLSSRHKTFCIRSQPNPRFKVRFLPNASSHALGPFFKGGRRFATPEVRDRVSNQHNLGIDGVLDLQNLLVSRPPVVAVILQFWNRHYPRYLWDGSQGAQNGAFPQTTTHGCQFTCMSAQRMLAPSLWRSPICSLSVALQRSPI